MYSLGMQAEAQSSKKYIEQLVNQNEASVCTSDEDSQRLLKFFEVLIRIDKNLKKKSNENNSKGDTNHSSKA
jgi:hypothetical protein